MSKTSNCLKLLEILQSVEFISSRNLATILNINKRNIIEYIKELEECGYIFESTIGVNGGYHLVGKNDKININETEITSTLSKAIEGYNKLNVYYFDYLNKLVHSLFHPYSYFESEGKISIYGYDESNNCFLFIGVESINEIKPSFEHFTKKKR